MKKLKGIFLIIVCLLVSPSCNTKTETDNKTIASHESKLKVENRQGIIPAFEMQDKDSLNFYLQKSAKLKKEHKPDLALEELNFALYYASSQEDINIVKKEIMQVDL